MLFLTDTCFWLHLQDLAVHGNLDFRPYLSPYRWGITPQVLQEIEWHQLDPFFPRAEAFVVPLTQGEIEAGQKRYPTIVNLDLADQTLFFAAIRDESILLTDDGDLYLESQGSNVEVLLLPQFCLRLAREGDIDKSEVYRAIRYWEQRRLFRQKEIKKWKAELAQIR